MADEVPFWSTGCQPAGAVILLPAVCTTTWASMTSPLVVPAGRLMVSDVLPAPLVPVVAGARSEIPPPGGGVGVGLGVGVGVVVGETVRAGIGRKSGVIVEMATLSVT